MIKPGDRVKVVTKDETAEGTEKSKISGTLQKQVFEGTLMPNEETNSVVIKLDNGYNVGIDNKKVKKIEIIESKKEKKETKKKIKEITGLKKIVILHTGGTIASKVDYETGAVTAKFSAEDLIGLFPELGEMANVETELVANMMSEDMNFADYRKLADSIRKHAKKRVDGVIIGHGTDTLTYTAAALSFMFEKINIPVLIVGSQRSSDRGSSDAASNLICAAQFITKSDFIGVAICMHNSTNDDKCAILPACKTRKMHTSRRDSFKAINDTPIALVDYEKRKIEFLKKDYKKKSDDNNVIVKDKFDFDVGLLKTHTNMKNSLFEFFTKSYKSFVIEGTGLGHAPTNLGEANLKNYESLKKFIKKGGIVAITSQCIFGRVHPHVYTNLRRLSGIGCVFCEDMLPETAFIKLAWLLGNYNDKEEVKRLLSTNLRGEINSRIEPEQYLE